MSDQQQIDVGRYIGHTAPKTKEMASGSSTRRTICTAPRTSATTARRRSCDDLVIGADGIRASRVFRGGIEATAQGQEAAS